MISVKNRRGSDHIAFNRIAFDLVTATGPVDISNLNPATSTEWFVDLPTGTSLISGDNIFRGNRGTFIYIDTALDNSDKSFSFEFNSTGESEFKLSYFSNVHVLEIVLAYSNGVVAITGNNIDSSGVVPWRVIDEDQESGYSRKLRVTVVNEVIYISVQKDGKWFVPFINIDQLFAAFPMIVDPLSSGDINYDYAYLVAEINTSSTKDSFSVSSSQDPIVYLETRQTDSAPFCHFESYNGYSLSLTCSPLPDGDHELSYLNDPYMLHVTSSYDSVDYPVMMTSSLSDLICTQGSILICQDESAAGVDNVGNLSVLPMCCFEDGSLKDTTPFEVVTSKSGYLTQQNDRTQIPEFNVREVNGPEYGCNFDFQRVFFNESSIEEHPILMRQCQWSTGKRIFYGLTVDELTTEEATTLSFSFTHKTYDLTVLELPGFTAQSVYMVRVIREDGSLIYASGLIKAPTASFNETLSIPDFESGRFFVDIDFFSIVEISGNDIFLQPIKDMSASVEVFRDGELLEAALFNIQYDMITNTYGYKVGSDTYDPLRTTAPITSVSPFHVRNKLVFELMPPEASVVILVYNPDTSAFTPFESGEVDVISVKLTKVLTKTRSISAIELISGHLCVFYRQRDESLTNSLFSSFEKNEIMYDVIDISDGTIVYTGVIRFESALSDTHSLFSFEVVREDDTVLIITSWRDLSDYVPKPSSVYPDISYPISPGTTEGIKIFTLGWETAFLGDLTLLGGHTAEASLKDIIDSQRKLNPDYYARHLNRNIDMKFALAGTMRANYCSEMDVTVLSIVDNSSRQPLIFMGKLGRFKAIASPLFFNANSFFAYTRSFQMDAVSSVIGHDGMIYSVATRGSWIQLGVIDPSIYWRANATLIDLDQPYISRYGEDDVTEEAVFPNWTRKDFTDYFVTMFSDMISEIIPLTPAAFVRPVIADLALHQHYMAFSIGSEIDFPFEGENAYPLIVYQNGHYDLAPNETTCAFSWQPHYETDSGSNYNSSSHFSNVFQPNLSNNSYSVLRNDSLSSVYLTPPYDYGDRLMYQFRLGGGYKYKSRVTTPESDVSSTFAMIASATGFYDFYDWQEARMSSLPLSSLDLVYGQVGFEIGSNHIQPFEVDLPDGTRTSVGDPIYVEDDSTYDLIIYIKQVDRDLAQVMWMIKRPVDFDSLTYNFKNDVVSYTGKVVSLLRDVNQDYRAGFADTFLEVTSESNKTYDYLKVHSLEVGILRSETSNYFRVYFEKGAGPDSILIERVSGSELGQWRDFNDERLLSYSGSAQYGFRIGSSDFNQATMSFHYYNGFTFTFGNTVSYSEDHWTVERVVANPASSAHVSNLHGYWISDEDNKPVTIQLIKAEDGPLRIDTVVLTGCNFRFAYILKYNPSDLSFNNIGILDSTYCNAKVVETTRTDSYGFITLENWLDLGKWSEEVKYISVNDSLPMKIVDIRGTSLKVEVPFSTNIPVGDAVIFGGNSLVTFNKHVTSEELYVYIPEQETFEGHYSIHTIDAGKTLKLSPDTVSEGFFSEQCSVYKDLVVGSQSFTQRQTSSQVKSIQLNYTTHLLKTWMELTSLVESLSVSRIPVWIFRDMKYKRKDYHLALISSAPAYSLLRDDEGSESYQITIPLRAVE